MNKRIWISIALAVTILFSSACDPTQSPRNANAHHIEVFVRIYEHVDIRGNRHRVPIEVALPFYFVLDGSVDGKKGTKLESGRTLPWDARLTSTHHEHLFVSRNAKTFGVIASGRYVLKRGANPNNPQLSIQCEIRLNGKREHLQNASIRSIGNTEVTCIMVK
jgi:hypothetical protein